MKDVNDMSLEEIEAMEQANADSNDIYRINARIKNLARSGGGSLTPVGDMLCNLYTHVIKDMYDLSNTLSDPEDRARLVELIKKHEDMPANLLEAVKGRVKKKQ